MLVTEVNGRVFRHTTPPGYKALDMLLRQAVYNRQI